MNLNIKIWYLTKEKKARSSKNILIIYKKNTIKIKKYNIEIPKHQEKSWLYSQAFYDFGYEFGCLYFSFKKLIFINIFKNNFYKDIFKILNPLF